ncbi:ParA family protein [Ensifer sp. SL37]|uniref:ParA family protein n=1 Tax=Ensifer sp. SL37 TaxID=2995137 RepID=UPI0022765E8E|nr:ParA family protein [Ensifer sp. SL37]MCY1741015.1 ParA family protein [Ensifer sp. SL37]
MLRIALVGQKGGAGKSTLCWALANAALARSNGEKVLLVETDPQGSTAAYVEKALARYPGLDRRLTCAALYTTEDLATILDEANEQGFDFVIIDTQGAHDDLPKNIMAIADRTLIPVRAVQHEYESQLATLTVYERLKDAFASDGEEIGPGGLLLNDFKASERLNLEQAAAFDLIQGNPKTLSFYMPRRNGYQTLGSGKILILERDALTAATDKIKRSAVEGDIAAAEAVLQAIEAMGHG